MLTSDLADLRLLLISFEYFVFFLRHTHFLSEATHTTVAPMHGCKKPWLVQVDPTDITSAAVCREANPSLLL